MHTDLYTVTWNEADMLGFFFRHYDPWIDRYVVYDDGSTDGTLERLRAHPRVELRRFERTTPGSFIESHRHLHDTCWKESRGRADWVVITAVDEHLHVPGVPMRGFLEARQREGATYVPALGFQMISDEFPGPGERLCETRTTGAPFWEMNKLSLFNPAALVETRFARGRHMASPRGRLRLPARDELLLLHYKYLDVDRTFERHAQLLGGLGPNERGRTRDMRYTWTRDRLCADWRETAAHAVDTSDPALRPWDTHHVVRWWRSPATHRAVVLAASVRRRLGRLVSRRR